MIEQRKEINILHLRSSGGLYGAEGVILTLAKELNNLGFNNYIVCINNFKNPHTELVDEAGKIGLSAESVPCRGRIDIKTIVAIRSSIKKYRIDILHCHDYKANFFGLFATMFLNISLITTNHLWTSETLILRFYEFLDGFLINGFHKVVAVSDEIKKELKKCVFKKSKIVTIYNGIDVNKYSLSSNGERIRKEFKIKDGYKIVGSVGRLSIQKGYDYFLEAARMVLDEMQQTVFLIVGDGILRRDLEEKVKRIGLINNVIFTGARTDVLDIYSCLDIFVLSSIREGLPMVILEALAMKKPAIATNVGGVSRVIKNERTGILLPPRNPEYLAQAIISLLKERDKAEFLALNGRKFIEEKFSSTVMAQKYNRIYEKLARL